MAKKKNKKTLGELFRKKMGLKPTLGQLFRKKLGIKKYDK